MKHREREFQTKFNRWLKHNWHPTACFELKIAEESSLPFNAVAEHQILALLLAKNNSLVFKIPDLGYTNPFDCIYLSGISAYIVIQFWRPRNKEFIMIDADVFKTEWQMSERKSLTEKRAKEIGFVYTFN